MLLHRILILVINCDTDYTTYVCKTYFFVEQLACVCNIFELHRVSIQEKSISNHAIHLLSSSVQFSFTFNEITILSSFKLIISIVRILNCSVLLVNMHTDFFHFVPEGYTVIIH